MVATADDSGATAWLALLGWWRSVPVMFADYAIVLEDRSLASGVVAQRPDLAAAAGPVLLALFAFLIAGQLVFELFVQRIQDADGVFPGFFGAQLLVQALLAYASDCMLIALLLETPRRAGYCTRIREPGVSFSGSTFGFSTVSGSTWS